MNCFIALATAISQSDDSLRYAYVMNVKSTVFYAFNLMTIQSKWVDILETIRNDAIKKSMDPAGGGAALAAAFNTKYQEESQEKDTQCGQWQTIIQTDQTEVNNHSDARKQDFSLAEGMAATTAVLNSLMNRI